MGSNSRPGNGNHPSKIRVSNPTNAKGDDESHLRVTWTSWNYEMIWDGTGWHDDDQQCLQLWLQLSTCLFARCPPSQSPARLVRWSHVDVAASIAMCCPDRIHPGRFNDRDREHHHHGQNLNTNAVGAAKRLASCLGFATTNKSQLGWSPDTRNASRISAIGPFQHAE